MDNNSAFWKDASRKVATWLGSATGVAVIAWVSHQVDKWANTEVVHLHGGHLAAAVIGVALVRAVIALAQGNVGDPTKASWGRTKVDVPAAKLRNPGPADATWSDPADDATDGDSG